MEATNLFFFKIFPRRFYIKNFSKGFQLPVKLPTKVLTTCNIAHKGFEVILKNETQKLKSLDFQPKETLLNSLK